MALVPGQVIHGRYRVISLLSRGGMGTIYEAMDLTLNVRCALKEMVPYPGTLGTVLPQLREQFRQEAQLLAELRHPNMPRVTDHFEEDGNAYLVMDFIYGRRLDEIIAQKGKLKEEEVLGWARQLMEALAYCHEQGVIHRDIKPQNVKITAQGRAMLLDFGLAKLVDPNDPRTRTVMRGLGTPEYAPPEQYDAKKGHTDPRTDVYSLGATLYHALAGQAPPTVTERVVNPESLTSLRQRRRNVSERTERTIMRALALQPVQRFHDMAGMHHALFGEPLLQVEAELATAPEEGDESTLAKPPSTTILLPWPGARGWRIDRRVGVAAAAVGFLSLVIVLSLVLDKVSVGISPTLTLTFTATTTATRAPTVTPSLTETSTAAPTASPTSRLPTRQPTRTPDELDLYFSLSVSPTLTSTASPTPVQLLPTSTNTPLPPTNTPPPTSKPQPPPPPPTNTPPPPPPTNTPPPPPTNTSPPPPPPTDTPLRPTPAPTSAPTSGPTPEPAPGTTPEATPEPSSERSSRPCLDLRL
jgi:serine/threonine-protein kinase